jgi:GH25 family lysozyme M1 (1,4-beta-N-acetylmuramidase)
MRFATSLLLTLAVSTWAYAQEAEPGLPLPSASAHATAPAHGPTPHESGFLEGMDVSQYQGTIDWSKVAHAGIKFAIIRQSDGFYHDPYFRANWAGAKAAGIVRGTYQYFRARHDGAEQAEDLLEQMGALDAGDLPPVCDVETLDGQSHTKLATEVQKWVDTIRQRTGRKPIIYSSPRVWEEYRMPSSFGSQTDLWIAHWGVSQPSLPAAAGWSDWKIWQWTSHFNVAGIGDAADGDRFHGSIDDLHTYVASTILGAPQPVESHPSSPVASHPSTTIGLTGAVDSTTGAPAEHSGHGHRPVATGNNPCPGDLPMLRGGSEGNDVRRLQTVLNASGAHLDTDGIYGPKTKAAVEEFQKTHDCMVDGIVGPETWAALEKAQPHAQFPKAH